MQSLSDENLYNAYCEHQDENALKTLLERHREALTGFLYGYVRNWEDAEELMLDAFAVIAAGRSRFLGKSSFKTWLFSIGKKQALMRIRKEKATLPLEEDPAGTSDDPELVLLENERTRTLYRAMDGLPADYRQVLVLLYFEEMKQEEIAVVMQKSRKQIYNLTDRARRALKQALEASGFHEDFYHDRP